MTVYNTRGGMQSVVSLDCKQNIMIWGLSLKPKISQHFLWSKRDYENQESFHSTEHIEEAKIHDLSPVKQ